MRIAKKYFINFIEEAVMNPKYKGFVGGRVEIIPDGEHYASEEIRFFTNKLSDFYRIRDLYDFKEVGANKLEKMRRELKGHNMRLD